MMDKEAIIKKLTEWQGVDRPLDSGPQPCIGKTPAHVKQQFDCPQKNNCLRYELLQYCRDGWTILGPKPNCDRFLPLAVEYEQDDYPPGMKEKIKRGLDTPLSECVEDNDTKPKESFADKVKRAVKDNPDLPTSFVRRVMKSKRQKPEPFTPRK